MTTLDYTLRLRSGVRDNVKARHDYMAVLTILALIPLHNPKAAKTASLVLVPLAMVAPPRTKAVKAVKIAKAAETSAPPLQNRARAAGQPVAPALQIAAGRVCWSPR